MALRLKNFIIIYWEVCKSFLGNPQGKLMHVLTFKYLTNTVLPDPYTPAPSLKYLQV